jgi:hypothetical protein
VELVDAQARQAIEQLQRIGWAVGPPGASGEWRRAVRAQARRAGLRIRTGEACGNSEATDGQLRPWAVTIGRYEGMRAQYGGLTLDTLGTIVVSAGAGASAANAVE